MITALTTLMDAVGYAFHKLSGKAVELFGGLDAADAPGVTAAASSLVTHIDFTDMHPSDIRELVRSVPGAEGHRRHCQGHETGRGNGMKYSEFKAEVEKMGFVVEDDGTPIYVDKSKDGETLVSIGKHKQFWLDPGWSGFKNLTDDQKLKLYDLAYQLAKTPPAEREEEKKYRVKFPGIKRDGKNIYLMRSYNADGTQGIDWSPKEYIFDDFPGDYLFTEKEIKSINEYYWHFAEEASE